MNGVSVYGQKVGWCRSVASASLSMCLCGNPHTVSYARAAVEPLLEEIGKGVVGHGGVEEHFGVHIRAVFVVGVWCGDHVDVIARAVQMHVLVCVCVCAHVRGFKRSTPPIS